MCDADNCVNKGTFPENEKCPGSDDENHHCVDCGQLWLDSNGLFCHFCNDYWCVDWQHNFKTYEETCDALVAHKGLNEKKDHPELGDWDSTEIICKKCFIKIVYI